MIHCLRFLLTLIGCLGYGIAVAEEREPSEFRTFSSKEGKAIEARILSVSDDLLTIRLEGKDETIFETPVTKLELGDQQFVREWLTGESPTTIGGRVKIFGILPGEKPIGVDELAEISDVQSVHAMKVGWMVRRANGEVLSFENAFPKHSNIERIELNTVWSAMANQQGKALGIKGGLHHEDLLSGVVQHAAGSGHYISRLADGTIKVWGRGYNAQKPRDPPGEISQAVDVATLQSVAAVVEASGKVHAWSPSKGEFNTAEIGDGATQIDGSIFHFLVLTRSGEVYEWAGDNPNKAQIPAVLKDEGPFQQVRCNGSTRAAQRLDGTWIAWGMNGAGIVDHINQLGPVLDLDFFSEPGKKDHGYVIWIEPQS